MLARARSRRSFAAIPPGSPFVRGVERGGFTLLEMVLALAVLAAVAAITWPAVQRVYADHAVKQAAERIRVELATARVKAIDSGLAYQFRYEPGGRRFVLMPYEQEMSESGSDLPYKESGFLEQGLAFYPPDALLSGTEEVPADWFQGLPDAQELAGASWSLPLLFFPDGTAQDSGLIVADQKGHVVPIALRGLTGSPTVGPVQRRPLE